MSAARIVHLGLGGFFRAHQAWYTGAAPDADRWGITAFTGRSPALAEALTRPWWNDRWRLAAWAVLGLAPLAAHGLWRSSRVLSAVVGRFRPRSGTPGTRPAVTAAAIGLALISALVVGYAADNSRRVATAYQSDRQLNAAETTAMAWLAPQVRDGETVMNDPGDGSAYLYAVAGVRPVFGHQIVASTLGPVQSSLRERFRCLDTDRGVREAVDDLEIRYVFLGTGFVREGLHRSAGLVGMAASPSVRLVYSEAGVRIYAVELQPAAEPLPGCPPVDADGPD